MIRKYHIINIILIKFKIILNMERKQKIIKVLKIIFRIFTIFMRNKRYICSDKDSDFCCGDCENCERKSQKTEQ